MSRIRTLLSLVVPMSVVLGAVAISACGGGGATAAQAPIYGGTQQSSAAKSPANGSSSAAALRTARSSVGTVLVDQQGRTVYLFKADVGNRSACSGACASAWPPVRASGKPVVGSGLTGAKVGTTRRSDGNPQVTYNGHPLYLYVGDTKPGDVTGQGLNQFGAAWFVLSPAGQQISRQP